MKKTFAPSKLKKPAFFVLAYLLFTTATSKVYSQTVVYDSIKKQKVVLIDIHKTYERIIEKGYSSVEMFEFLGNYYYKDQDFQKSKLYFDMLFKKYKLSQISQKSIDLYKTL